MRAPLLVVSALVVSALVGCSGADGSTTPASDDSDVTSLKYYDCHGGGSDESMSHIQVGISGSQLELTDLSKGAEPPGIGKIDPSYHPTSATYAGAVRYTGYESVFSNSVDVLVPTDMQSRQAQTTMWIRFTGSDGGNTTKYSCKAMASKLKVVASTNARLACDLAQMSCTHDNPPGDTCLETLFVNQTGDSATAKLHYLDHFGVHVVDRDVALGASTSLSRTTSATEGAWKDGSGTWQLKLDYRAGITYTGTFKLSNGESAKVQCNDLAMLD